MAKIVPERFKIKKGDEVILRSYQPGDEDDAQRFARKIASESSHTLKYDGMPQPPKEQLTRAWLEFDAHPVNVNIGAFYHGDVVGNLRFFQRNSSHPWVKHVAAFGMAVSKDLWGQGLGQRMLELMEAHARACGVIRIEAEVRAANKRGIQLYSKNGFKIEGRREKAACIDEVFLDELYIAKLLI